MAIFADYKTFYSIDKYECSQTVTPNGEDPYNFLFSIYRYSLDENNTIKIYEGGKSTG